MKGYAIVLVIAAALATLVYEVALWFLPVEWQKIFLMLVILGAFLGGFVRWIFALMDDPRDPLELR